MTPEQAVDAAFDEIKPYLPTIDLADRMEKCRALALLALRHPCPQDEAVRIWEGKDAHCAKDEK